MRLISNAPLARALVASCVASVVVVGCKTSSAKKLEGRWRGIKATGVATEQIPAANLFASTMELDFHGDQVSVHVGSDKQSGHFRVVEDGKTQVVLFTEQDGPADKQTFVFNDDKTMSWSVESGRTIQFQKE